MTVSREDRSGVVSGTRGPRNSRGYAGSELAGFGESSPAILQAGVAPGLRSSVPTGHPTGRRTPEACRTNRLATTATTSGEPCHFCDEPISGEPVRSEGDTPPLRAWCSAECLDRSAERQWMRTQEEAR